MRTIATRCQNLDRVGPQTERVENLLLGLDRMNVQADDQRRLTDDLWLQARPTRRAEGGHDRIGASGDDLGHGRQIESRNRPHKPRVIHRDEQQSPVVAEEPPHPERFRAQFNHRARICSKDSRMALA